MKAAFIEQFGGREVLRYGNLPDPVAAPGEVVIDVVAGQRADWKVRVGQYKQSKFPFVLGRDFSGLISAVGEGVMDLKLGDAVFGVCEAGQEGAYAEKIAVKAAAALMLSADEYQSPATATGVTRVVVSSSTVESS
jgi:NADPH:quinone reductase-like Zn-dependent oxidoreductase